MTSSDRLQSFASSALLPLLVVLTLGATRPVAAQDATQAARERACLDSAPELMQRNASQRAQFNLRNCPDAGPRLLADRWRNPPDDTVMIRDLVWASVTTIDERIFATTLQIVADPARPREVRIGALSVASNYADPALFPVFDKRLREDRPITASGPTKYLDFHSSWPKHISGSAGQVRGARPVLGDPRQRLVATLQGIQQQGSEDEYVLGAARALLSLHFRLSTRSGAPVDTAYLRRIELGHTTVAEIQARLGAPDAVIEASGQQIWRYDFWQMNPTGGLERTKQIRSFAQTLTITVRNGRVANYSLTGSNR